MNLPETPPKTFVFVDVGRGEIKIFSNKFSVNRTPNFYNILLIRIWSILNEIDMMGTKY